MMALKLNGVAEQPDHRWKEDNEAGIEKSGREHRGPRRSEIVLTFFYERGRFFGGREHPGPDRFDLYAPGL